MQKDGNIGILETKESKANGTAQGNKTIPVTSTMTHAYKNI
jgi:hypothetical protein